MSAKMTPIDARAMMILILGASLPAWAYSFAGGTGEPNDPYQIATAEQLVSIGSDPNLLDKHFALLNDIDLDPNLPGGRAFTAAVIAPRQGAYLWQGVPFTGVFDGCSHSIKNLTFQRSATLPISDFVALFGNVARGAVVSDLKVENANFQQQDGYFVGVLVAWNEGRIIRCGASGTIPGNQSVGILAGYNRGEIIDCWSEGDVAGESNVGGLVGFNSYGIVLNCHAACEVLVTSRSELNYGGGLVGQNLHGQIVNCWATGKVLAPSGARVVGGLVGYNSGGVIAGSYVTGNVSAGETGTRLVGLVGVNDGTIDDCLATANGSAGDDSRRLSGAGTPDDPFRIATTEDLDAVNHHDLTASYRLEADIDLGSIVRNKPVIRHFDGVFDGAGRTIADLTIRGGDHLGLFGGLGTRACVTNLGIRDASITGSGFLGSLTAMNRGKIITCRIDGAVAGSRYLGLLTAWNDGDISDSYCRGSMSSDAAYVGGLATWNIGRIDRCYAAVHVSCLQPYLGLPDSIAHSHPGGLVGVNQEPSWSGVAFVKGLSDIPGEIHDSYFLIDTDGGGPDNGFGAPLTQDQMMQQARFPGFDFENTWTICEGRGYPRLRWERVACEP